MKFAVYGTLRRGGLNNHLMRGSKYLGPDKVKATLYRLGWFPGIRLDGEPKHEVVIDIYDVPEGSIGSLDRYEGFVPGSPDQSLFIRKEVITEGGETVQIYEYAAEEINPSYITETGDWFHECPRLAV